MTKRIDVVYGEDSGCYHIILIFPNGDEVDVATHCDMAEAEAAADYINRWSQT